MICFIVFNVNLTLICKRFPDLVLQVLLFLCICMHGMQYWNQCTIFEFFFNSISLMLESIWFLIYCVIFLQHFSTWIEMIFGVLFFLSIDAGDLQECCQSTCACLMSWYDFRSPCFSALMQASSRSVVSLRCRASTCACFTSRWFTRRRRAGMRTCSTWTMTWCLSLLWFVCQQSTCCRSEVGRGILKVCRCMYLW